MYMSALPAWFSKTRRGHQISRNCHERDSSPCSSLVEGLWLHCKKQVIPLSSSSCVPTVLSCYTPAVGPERLVSFNDNQPDHHPLSASCHQTQPSLCSLYCTEEASRASAPDIPSEQLCFKACACVHVPEVNHI